MKYDDKELKPMSISITNNVLLLEGGDWFADKGKDYEKYEYKVYATNVTFEPDDTDFEDFVIELYDDKGFVDSFDATDVFEEEYLRDLLYNAYLHHWEEY